MLGGGYSQLEVEIDVVAFNKAHPDHRRAIKWCYSCKLDSVVDAECWLCKECRSQLELKLEI